MTLHLNIAETFWRKAKYEWLKPTDYFSIAKYKQKIKEIFTGIDYKLFSKNKNLILFCSTAYFDSDKLIKNQISYPEMIPFSYIFCLNVNDDLRGHIYYTV